MATALEARGNKATLTVDALERVRVTNVRAEFETFSTGGAYITTPNDAEPQEELPAFKGFDHLESFYTDFRIQPAGNIFAVIGSPSTHMRPPLATASERATANPAPVSPRPKRSWSIRRATNT